ncbi:MAG: hypothetical protein JSS56_11785 [Proteobacteria bacterium]|nr:hypothetical protein [Pseudomonadota bacterium]
MAGTQGKDLGILDHGVMSSATGANPRGLARQFLPLTTRSPALRIAGTARSMNCASMRQTWRLPCSDSLSSGALGAASRLMRDVMGVGFELTGIGLRCAEPAAAHWRSTPTRALGATLQRFAPSPTPSGARGPSS